MRIDVFTIFPEMVGAFAGRALLGKAVEAGKLDVRVHDLRAETTDVHRSVDDAPFGGGAGVGLMPQPLFAAGGGLGPPPPPFGVGPRGPRVRPALGPPPGPPPRGSP